MAKKIVYTFFSAYSKILVSIVNINIYAIAIN